MSPTLTSRRTYNIALRGRRLRLFLASMYIVVVVVRYYRSSSDDYRSHEMYSWSVSSNLKTVLVSKTVSPQPDD